MSGGLAQNLAKRRGNVTGVRYYATELTAKRLELLKEMIPGISTVGVLANAIVSYLPFEKDTKQAAGQLDLALKVHQVSEAADLKIAFLQMRDEQVEANSILAD